jgi:tetratricopeptide (TPR) repeat protein
MKKRFLGIAALVFFLTLQVSAQTCPEFWSQIKSSSSSQDSIDVLKRYIQSNCKDSLAEGLYLLTLNNYLHGGADSLSLTYINNAINLDSLNYKYYMIRGDICHNLRLHNEALNDYRKSLRLMNAGADLGSKARTLNAIGGTLIDFSLDLDSIGKVNQLQEAINTLKQAILLYPNFDNPYFLLGNAYFYLENFDESIKSLENCRMINPQKKHLLKNLAIVYQNAGRFYGEKRNNLDSALVLLQKSYELDSLDTETIRLLGVGNGIKGNKKTALYWFNKRAQQDPNNSDAWWDLHIAYRELGKKRLMKKCRKNAIEIDPQILERKKQH